MEQSQSPTPRVIEVKVNMDFPGAMQEVIAGKKIRRMEWEDKEVYGFLNGNFLSLHKADGKNYQWIINDGDLLSDDWVVTN